MRSLAWYSTSLALTHAVQQEGRLDPSQSAQLLLPRRDAILLAPIRREGRGWEGTVWLWAYAYLLSAPEHARSPAAARRVGCLPSLTSP